MKKFKKFFAIFLMMFSLLRLVDDAFPRQDVDVMSETNLPYPDEEEKDIIYPY